ncbi:MAG: hypothetical protein LW878_00105, partial [Proteobacteria bacterium]|nr:hypothetical protein [Pseudomonadota bacterium]
MKAYNYQSHGHLSLESIGVIKSKELVYLRYEAISGLFLKDKEKIASIGAKTSQLFVSLPAEEASGPTFFDDLIAIGVSGVALRFKYDSKKWLNQVGFGVNHSGDRDVVESFQNLMRIKPRQIELVAELEVEDDTRVLGSTIASLHSYGCSWVVVNVPVVPTEPIVRKMAEIFEYLKIRGLLRLNVYFPFWLPSIEEWNVKTQNTLSGLSEIHIDLSNRCTHSCVFCGLYAPESVNELKGHHGGKLPKEIIDHMSKEINFEKCNDFIQTLPWTVRQIQFGGLGDPLMHKHAVDLIRAARDRGF